MEMPTLINVCSKIVGELILATDIRIDGKVYGKVESDKNIVIGKDGYVQGFLRAKNLVVFGRVEGNIVTSGVTVLHPNSSIFGSLYTKVIDVKEGANVTARVITYDKLEAQDEAQIYMAEEILSFQSNKSNDPLRQKYRIISNRDTEIAEKKKKPVYLRGEKLMIEPTQSLSEGGENKKFERKRVDQPFEFTFEKNTVLKTRDASLKELRHNHLHRFSMQKDLCDSRDTVTKFSPGPDKSKAEFVNVNSSNVESTLKFSTSDLLPEPEAPVQINEPNLEPTDSVALAPLSQNNNNLQQKKKITESPVQGIDQTSANPQNIDEEAISKPKIKSVLFASLMEQQLQNDSVYLINEMIQINQSVNSISAQTGIKGKDQAKYGLKELKNLLIWKNSQEVLPGLNQNNQIKSNPNLGNESGNEIRTEATEKKEPFLAGAIKQLPSTDFLSHFK